MFRPLRSIAEGLHGVRSAVLLVNEALRSRTSDVDIEGPLVGRVEALELTRAIWEAEVEGVLLKAQNQYKAAAAADSRARTKQRNDEDIFGESPEDGPRPVEASPVARLPEGDAEAGPENPVPAVRVGLGPDGKDEAQTMKWGAA